MLPEEEILELISWSCTLDKIMKEYRENTSLCTVKKCIDSRIKEFKITIDIDDETKSEGTATQ